MADKPILDLPPYPAEFTPTQRCEAYWAMIQLRTAHPTVTNNWYRLLELSQNRRERVEELVAAERAREAEQAAAQLTATKTSETAPRQPYKD